MKNEFSDFVRGSLKGVNPSCNGGNSDNVHDQGGRFDRIFKGALKVFPGDLTVAKAQNESIDRGNHPPLLWV